MNTALNIIAIIIFVLLFGIPVYKIVSEDYDGSKKWFFVILVLAIFIFAGWLFDYPPGWHP